jgi:hypothetical protein
MQLYDIDCHLAENMVDFILAAFRTISVKSKQLSEHKIQVSLTVVGINSSRNKIILFLFLPNWRKIELLVRFYCYKTRARGDSNPRPNA